VKYPNGNMHYVGEYDNGKEIGKWQMYDEQGNVTVTDYDALN
jgi:antitoxin component YwqK of YwqJK toxin-antitoxin module